MRLTTSLWASALVRRVFASGGFAAILRHGADSAGAVFLTGTAWPDLIVGVNDSPVRTFRNRRRQNVRLLQVRLAGLAGNPTAAGARVSVRRADGLVQTAEATLGGGYLSQHASTLWFGLDQVAGPVQIEVRWPDGQTSQHEIPDGAEEATLAHPERTGDAPTG